MGARSSDTRGLLHETLYTPPTRSVKMETHQFYSTGHAKATGWVALCVAASWISGWLLQKNNAKEVFGWSNQYSYVHLQSSAYMFHMKTHIYPHITCTYTTISYDFHFGPVTPLSDSFILEPPQKYPWNLNFTAAFRRSKLFLHHGIEVVCGDARWDRRFLCA